MKKEELTQKYVEFQVLNQQIQKSQQQLNILSNQINELKNLSQNLSELSSSVKENSEMYSNLGVGVYTKSEIKDPKHLLVNVGAGILVKKTPDETIKIVDKQTEELDKFTQNMQNQIQLSVKRAEELRQEIAEAQKKK